MTFLDVKKHVHLIGIGGIGISALARMLLERGYDLSGTNDSESKETLDELRAGGVAISLDIEPKNLPHADLYIYSDAWLTNHPEVITEARSRGVSVVSFYEALGEVANKAECLVVVAGSHGKTTTTAMLIDDLEADHLDYYKDLADVQSAFRELAQKVPTDGFVVCDTSDKNVQPVIAGLQ